MQKFYELNYVVTSAEFYLINTELFWEDNKLRNSISCKIKIKTLLRDTFEWVLLLIKIFLNFLIL